MPASCEFRNRHAALSSGCEAMYSVRAYRRKSPTTVADAPCPRVVHDDAVNLPIRSHFRPAQLVKPGLRLRSSTETAVTSVNLPLEQLPARRRCDGRHVSRPSQTSGFCDLRNDVRRLRPPKHAEVRPALRERLYPRHLSKNGATPRCATTRRSLDRLRRLRPDGSTPSAPTELRRD